MRAGALVIGLAIIVGGCAPTPLPSARAASSSADASAPPPATSRPGSLPSASANPSPAPATVPAATPAPTPAATPAPSGAPGEPTPGQAASVSELPASASMNDVAFADSRHGWLAGNGEILGTSDGGRTWRIEWRQPGMLVPEVDALDATHAWAIAQRYGADGTLSRQTVLRTADGRHWVTATVPHTLIDLTFTSPLSGWAVDQGVVPQGLWTGTGTGESPGHLAYTGDGGRTWTPTGVRDVDAVCFDGERVGWASGPSGVWSTRDGGRRWHRVGPQPGRSPLFDMSLDCRGGRLWLFQNLMGGATGHEDYAGWTSGDGGRRWRQVLWNGFFPGGSPTASSADDYPGPLAAPSATTAVEAGWSPNGTEVSLTVTRDGGRTWRTSRLPGVQNLAAVAAPDVKHWFVLAQSVPGRSVLVASADGGRSWREAWPSASPAPVGAVAFAGPALGLGTTVPGDDRAVVATSDGGRTWRLVGELPDRAGWSSSGAPALALPDPAHGWAVTASGRLLVTGDGGRTWRRVALPVGAERASSAAFSGPERGCVGLSAADGSPAGELRTVDGGRTWAATAPALYPVTACAAGDAAAPVVAAAAQLTAQQVPDLAFAGDRRAWLLTDTGLWWTSDGGATWSGAAWPQDPASAPSMFGPPVQVQFVSAEVGWASMFDGRLFRTGDGGSTWEELP